jgi:hypothetical protein
MREQDYVRVIRSQRERIDLLEEEIRQLKERISAKPKCSDLFTFTEMEFVVDLSRTGFLPYGERWTIKKVSHYTKVLRNKLEEAGVVGVHLNVVYKEGLKVVEGLDVLRAVVRGGEDVPARRRLGLGGAGRIRTVRGPQAAQRGESEGPTI